MGYRVELDEIEKISNSIEGVDLSCIFYDEIEKKIVCVFSSTDINVDKVFLLKKLREKLVSYMVPNAFVQYRQMPISGTGKIDRTRIKEDYFLHKNNKA